MWILDIDDFSNAAIYYRFAMNLQFIPFPEDFILSPPLLRINHKVPSFVFTQANSSKGSISFGYRIYFFATFLYSNSLKF